MRAWALSCALALSAVLAGVAITTAPIGLTASVRPSPEAPPGFTAVDSELSRFSADALTARSGSSSARVSWDGFIYARASRDYTFGIAAAAWVRLRIDGAIVLEHQATAAREEPTGTKRLTAGQHLINLDFELRGAPPDLQLKWDEGSPHRLSAIPAAFLSPRSLGARAWWLRAWLPGLVTITTAVWSVVIVWLLWRLVRRVLPLGDVLSTPSVRWSLAASALLFLAGVWWGWPGGGWAPDEFDPGAVFDAWARRFSGGWHGGVYPPMQFYLLTIVDAPALIAGWLHLTTLRSGAMWDVLYLQARLLTIAMALGVLTIVAAIARRTIGRGCAWPAALLTAMFLPFTYYAKMANVDVPYLFWFAASMLLLSEALESGLASHAAGAAVAAGLAIATKDQAYGLYVLPGLYLAWRLVRAGRYQALAAAALAGLATVGLADNLVFNYDGFLAHLTEIRHGLEPRTYPMTVGGQWALLEFAGRHLLAWMLGWPGLALVAIGAYSSLRSRPTARHAGWLFLPVVSYWITSIAVIGYVYDRYLLPVTMILALVGALGLRRLLDGWPHAKAGPAIGWVLLAWIGWRAVSVDALLISDSRYQIETWLRDHVPAGAMVASVDPLANLPRLGWFHHRQMTATAEATSALRPEFIVVNAEFAQRYSPESGRGKWQAWLESAAGDYVEAFRYKNPLTGSALRFDGRFTDRVEDPYTNLDKANPEIVVYRRRR